MGEVTSACYNPDTPQFKQELSYTLAELSPGPTIEKIEYQPMPASIRQLIDISLDSIYAKKILKFSKPQADPTQIHFFSIGIDRTTPQSPRHVIFQGHHSQSQTISGYGTIHFPNGHYFEGILRDNLPQVGIYVFNPYCYYLGTMKGLTAHGMGKYQNQQNGFLYEGNWQKNLPHGHGKQVYSDGDKFEGEFIYGAKYGQGSYIFADGSKYEGSFYNNLNDGQGTMLWANGNSYTGEWKLGLMQGRGKYKWANGESYEGHYQNGKRHGVGKYRFSNNSFYEGQWEYGLQSGKGVIKQSYDEIIGVWQAGVKID